MEPTLYQGHSTFRNQPSYKIFNKSFDNPQDVFFLQLNEIDPYFLTNEQLKDESGFLQEELVDPRTKREQQLTIYNNSDEGKNLRIFKGGGIMSTLVKRQQIICLRVLLGWQEKKEIDEADLIVWRQLESKIAKERDFMHRFIREYAETHKEDIYAPTKRLNEYYRNWFKRKADLMLRQHPENLAFNTHTGLPHVSVCKNVNDDKAEICDVQLLKRSGWVRTLVDEVDDVKWRNFHFRLEEHTHNFNNALNSSDEQIFKNYLETELNDLEDDDFRKICYIPFETILFLLTAGEYVDLPTECLLEISDTTANNQKIIKFDSPFPARNCGWHTQQLVVEHALSSFHSKTGRSKWLHVENEIVKAEVQQESEIHAVCVGDIPFKPLTFEQYLENYKTKESETANNIKSNRALIKWYLKPAECAESIMILTTLSLPPALDDKAQIFLPHEFVKLEYKPQFGCEMLTKHELLRAWLKMRLMSFTKTADCGFCYRISSIDSDIQLKEQLSLEIVEKYLKFNYHVDPVQLIANFSEFLKLLYNMPTTKYMLRYNFKYRDKMLLCAPTKEITQNTVYLHSLLQTEPTDMTFMTQQPFLPIIETLCSRVHLKHKTLPCVFLPKLPHQKNLQTAETKARADKLKLLKKQASGTQALETKKARAGKVKPKPKKNKQRRQARKKRVAAKEARDEEAENKKLFEY